MTQTCPNDATATNAFHHCHVCSFRQAESCCRLLCTPSSINLFSFPPAGHPQLLPLMQPAHHQGTLHQHEMLLQPPPLNPAWIFHNSHQQSPIYLHLNTAGGSTFPPSMALISNPPHQPGKVPSTGLPVLGYLPFQPFPPYGYGRPFHPAPPGIHGMFMSNGYSSISLSKPHHSASHR